jgi:hypothetical protein
VANEKIKYSNGCSPQELDSTSARWYQDSDVGTKLSGSANVSMGGGTLTYQSSKEITGVEPPSGSISSKDFIFVRNISGDDVKITLDGTNYLVKLSAGESFASELDSTVATVKINTDGTSTVEYLSGT